MSATDKFLIALFAFIVALQDFEDGKTFAAWLMVSVVAINVVACIAIIARRLP